jgi:hypothetical protein
MVVAMLATILVTSTVQMLLHAQHVAFHRITSQSEALFHRHLLPIRSSC